MIESSIKQCLPSHGPAPRRNSVGVKVGSILVGGGAPIVVQSMTNTDTADVKGTVEQVAALARAGSELVRITVNNAEAAAAVPVIREQLDRRGANVPLVAFSPAYVRAGALLALYTTPTQAGSQAAHWALEVLANHEVGQKV